MPLNRRRLFQEGPAYKDEPFDLRFDSFGAEGKVIGQPEIVSFEPPGAPPIPAKHLIHDANGDIITVRGKLTAEDRDAILSGKWTIMRSPSDLFPQVLPSRAVPVAKGFNPVVFKAPIGYVPPFAPPTRSAEVSIPSISSNGSTVLPATPPSSIPSPTTHNAVTPTLSLPCTPSNPPVPPQKVALLSRDLSPTQPVVIDQTASSSPPSESVSSCSHVVPNPSGSADTGGHRSLKRKFTSDAGPSPSTADCSNPSTSPLSKQTILEPLKRALTPDLLPLSDDTVGKSPKRQRALDGQPRQPSSAMSGSQGSRHPTPGSGMYMLRFYRPCLLIPSRSTAGLPPQERSGANGIPSGEGHPTRSFKPMLPYNAKTGRKLRREGAFIEKDFGKYTAWLPNPPPHAYSDDPTHTSSVRTTGRPLKRSGAVIGFKVGNRTKWFPPPPPSGFYGRSCGDLSASTSTTRTPVKPPSSPAELGPSLGQRSSTSDNVQTPPSTQNSVPATSAVPDTDNLKLKLEYVDNTTLLAPPIAASTHPSAPSSSIVSFSIPETPTPSSRIHRHIGAIRDSSPSPRIDTKKRSRDEDEDESLRPTFRIRISSVPLPVDPPAAASSSSTASSQAAVATIAQEAPPPRRSSRLARAAKKLRK